MVYRSNMPATAGILTFSAKKLTLLICCATISACGGPPNETVTSPVKDSIANAQQCIASQPWQEYGEGLHAVATDLIPSSAARRSNSTSTPQCASNKSFRFAAARADMTGPAAGKIILASENPEVYTRGIHTRQYARSFIIESPCNGKRILLTQAEMGMMFESVRNEVLRRIAEDPALSPHYNTHNIMINASHTHSGPGGQAHYLTYNALRLGHDTKTFEITVKGIFNSIKQAHENFEKHTHAGTIKINHGEILNANKNRSLHAYAANSEGERSSYLDKRNQEVNTPRVMTLLKLEHPNGTPAASINWFGVHPTSDVFESMFEIIGKAGGGPRPISSDSKGYAGYLMERIFRTHNPDFVSSFQQAEEGDSFPRLFYDNPEEAERHRALLPQDQPFSLTVANGDKQLLNALDLYATAESFLEGPVEFRFSHVQMDQVEVTDSYVLDSLQHPAHLDVEPKRTCAPAFGVSFPSGGGGSVAPGEIEEGKSMPTGITCSDPELAQLLSDSFQTASQGAIPTQLFAASVGCGLQQAPALNLACHAEKPILLTLGEPFNATASIVPFQLFRIGNLAIVGLPWEITTMAGRRIRATVLDVLQEDGIDHVVINGLSNDYSSYLTTREEYSIQQYEGASNQFGPWTLAAIQQEIRRLAQDMVSGAASDPGPTPPTTFPTLISVLPPQGTDATPLGHSFGEVLEDAQNGYSPGDTVRVTFQASSPNSDTKNDGSFLFVEQLIDDEWVAVFQDRDPETTFIWHSDSPAPQITPTLHSTAEILWRIPHNIQGEFRVRFEGVANQLGLKRPYQGISKSFVVSGDMNKCP